MITRWQKPISIAFGIFSAGLFVAFVAFVLVNWAYVAEAEVSLVEPLLSIATFSFLGLLLSYRRPENIISWLFVVIALLRQTGYLRAVLGVMLEKGIEPTFGLLFWGNLWIWLSGFTYTLLAFVIVLFPSGRLPTRRWRPAAWLLGLQAVLAAGLITFVAYDLYRVFSLVNSEAGAISVTAPVTDGPLAVAIHVRSIPELSTYLIPVALIALVMVLLGLWSQIRQYQHGDSVVRQQIKWVIFAVILWAFTLALIFFIPIDVPYTILLFVAPIVPITIALAILRYRIYDIDLIIRRTLVYGALTILLAIIYFGSVTLLQILVSTVSGQESPFIIVISTLIIAALFAPLRSGVQRFIDRRFYRRRYDAEKILAHFATTTRDEVDLSRLTAELMRVVEKTMQPQSLSLWLKDQ